MLVNYSNGGKKWTKSEYELLIVESSKSSKIDYASIAKSMFRTKKSVMEKVSKICDGTDSNMSWVNEILASMNKKRTAKLTNNLRKNTVDAASDKIQKECFGLPNTKALKAKTAVKSEKENVIIHEFKSRIEIRNKLKSHLIKDNGLFILDGRTLKVLLGEK